MKGVVPEHGKDMITRIGASKVTCTLKLVHKAIAVGVAARPLRRDEPLKDVLDNTSFDIKVLAQVVILRKLLTDTMQNPPIDFHISPKNCCRSAGPDFLNYPNSGELDKEVLYERRNWKLHE